jgi:uncharacterized protein with PQ loop repeat
VAGVSWEELVGWLFVATNSARLLAYLPQIVATVRCRAGAKSVSILTWGYFGIAHFSALLYAIYVLRDSRLSWVFAGNLTVTLILVAIILWKRFGYKYAERYQPLTTSEAVPDAALRP